MSTKDIGIARVGDTIVPRLGSRLRAWVTKLEPLTVIYVGDRHRVKCLWNHESYIVVGRNFI